MENRYPSHGGPAQAIQPTGWLSWSSTARDKRRPRPQMAPRFSISAADRNARQGRETLGVDVKRSGYLGHILSWGADDLHEKRG